MLRILCRLLAVLVAATLFVPAASAGSPPILGGPAYPYYRQDGLRGTRGFSQVEPREIFYGGDVTGLVCRIRWKTWGGSTAVGYGAGWYINSHQTVAQGHTAVAIVKASGLGTWHGRSAYLHLRWSFPQHGNQRVPEC